MTIKELTYSDEEWAGIQAISLVKYPAIETDFVFFNKQNFLNVEGINVPQTNTQKLLHPTYGWKYWEIDVREGDMLLENSHSFCKEHAGKVFSVNEIQNFQYHKTAKYDLGWKTQSTFCQTFQGIKNADGFNLDNQIFNCRHFLKPVRDINKVPDRFKKPNGELMSSQNVIEKFNINFEITNMDKREIKGVCMIPNMLIYRRNEYGQEYYVWFSKETIKKYKEKFGFNRSITIQHAEEGTGKAILLDSWLFDGQNDDCGYNDLKDGSWCLKYKIVSDSLWENIKEKKIKGFSIEILLPIS
jgi:hypothetical protein